MKPIVAELVRATLQEAAKRKGDRLPSVAEIFQSPQVREIAHVAEQEIDELPGEKPQWKSKIIMTQIVALIASLLVAFGIELDAETQAGLVVVFQGLAAGLTYVWRKWFTTTKVL